MSSDVPMKIFLLFCKLKHIVSSVTVLMMLLMFAVITVEF